MNKLSTNISVVERMSPEDRAFAKPAVLMRYDESFILAMAAGRQDRIDRLLSIQKRIAML